MIILGAALSSLWVSSGDASSWRVFKSPDGFVISYPATWTRYPALEASDGSLQISVIRETATGLLPIKGRAEIYVSKAHFNEPDEIIERNGRLGGLKSRKILSKSAVPNCDKAQEFIQRNEIGPHTYSVATILFCVAGGRAYSIDEENWEGDKKQPLYQKTAHHMLRSLRIAR